MSRPFFYCSELSSGAAEQPHGTASTGEVWLLVEYPRAWGAKALEESDLSRAVKSYLNRTCRSIPRSRLLFVKQERDERDSFNLFIVRSRERSPFILKFQLESYEQLPELDVAALATGKRTPQSANLLDGPLLLVCTHGRRDKCCAKFGYALYKSLRAEAEPGGARVWQSSHVGGDRFAANMICFPHGLFYAHVSGDAGRAIASEYAAGRLMLEGYRGRACYGHVIQSAEFFIRRESGLRGLDDLRYLCRHQVSDNRWRVQFSVPAQQTVHTAQVTSRLSEFQNFITCHSTEEQQVVQYELEDYEVVRWPY